MLEKVAEGLKVKNRDYKKKLGSTTVSLLVVVD